MSQKSCEHNHPEDAPARFAKFGNLALGIIGFAVGLATKSPAVISDSGHNAGDYLAHRQHIATTEAERHGSEEQAVQASTKKAAKIIGAIALGTALYSGYHMHEALTSEQPPEFNKYAAAVELGSVGLNFTVRQKNKKIPPELQGQKHSNMHNNVDLGCSVAAFTGIVLNPFVPFAESAVGIGVSYVTAKFAKDLHDGKGH